MTTEKPDAEVLALLARAEIDPVIAIEIAEDVLGGYEEDAVERLLEEMNIDEDQAQRIFEHLQTVLPGKDMVLEEITADQAVYLTMAQRVGPGNPFVAFVRYFGRRGLRVFPVTPFTNGKGERQFIADGAFIEPEGLQQIWRTAEKT